MGPVKKAKFYFLKKKLKKRLEDLIVMQMNKGFDADTATLIVLSYLNGLDDNLTWTALTYKRKKKKNARINYCRKDN